MFKIPYYRQLIILSLILVSIPFIAQLFLNKKNKDSNKKICYEHMNTVINGIVKNAYYDENINIKSFVIEFTDGDKYTVPYFIDGLNTWNIKEGDSIAKKAGTFRYEIYKQNGESVIIVDTLINCEKLK